MVTPELFSAAWATASGVGLAVLAAFTLTGVSSRTRGALPFGLFALAWAIQVVTINVAPHTSQAVAEPLYVAALGALLAMPYLLVEFAAAYAAEGGRTPAWRAVRWTLGSLAVGGAGLLAFRPELLLEGSYAFSGLVYPDWSDLKVAIVDVPRIAAFGLALVALHAAFRASPTERTRNRTVVLLAGLGLYIAYAAGNNAVSFAPTATTGLASGTVYFVGFGLLSLLVLGLGLVALRAFADATTEGDRRRELLLGGALLFPLAWGVAERALLEGVVFQSVGLWRLAGVAVIAYGLARWRIYDLPRKVRRAASSATGAAGALAGGATAFGLVSLVTGGVATAAFGAVVVTGATMMPGVRLARRVMGPPSPQDSDAVQRERFGKKVDAYRAAVESAMSRGTLEQDRAFLASLREEFQLEAGQARVVEHYARETVVPIEEGDPDGAYERMRMLGEGGAGRTWLARDRARDRLVVLKEPLETWHDAPEVLEAARREAKLAAKVDHPNVVEIEEVIEDDGVPVLVMEHVAGGSLHDLLRDEAPLAWRRAVRLVEDVARGLAAVHATGVVHRDVKPANVLLTEDGVAKVTDFGVASERDDAGGTQVLEDRDPAGTEAYMAPEVRHGVARADEVSDVYGCAAVLHACLAGRPPGDEAADLDHLPQRVREVLRRGLARRPEDRYESARAFAEALAEVRSA